MLLIWLRLHDAVVHDKANKVEIIKTLFPEFAPHKKADDIDPLELARASKKFAYHLKRAREWVDRDYLTLVPLDYLQERSSKRRLEKQMNSERNVRANSSTANH